MDNTHKSAEGQNSNTEKEHQPEASVEFLLNKNFKKIDYFHYTKELKEKENELKEAKIYNFSEDSIKEIKDKIEKIRKKINVISIDNNEKNKIDKNIDSVNNFKEKIKKHGVDNLDQSEKNEYKKNLDEYYELNNQINSEKFTDLLNKVIDSLRSEEIKKFVKQNCIFEIDNNSEKLKLEVLGDKLSVTLGAKSIYENSLPFKDALGFEKHMVYFRPDKASFQIGQTIGYILQEPENWEKVAPKQKFTQDGKAGDWIDFCGLCLSQPYQASNTFDKAYEFFYNKLNGFSAKSIKINKETKTLNTQVNTQISDDNQENIFSKERTRNVNSADLDRTKQQWKEAKNFWQKADQNNSFGFLLNFMQGMVSKTKRDYWWAHQTVFSREGQGYQNIAQFENKQVSILVDRNDFVTDRDRALACLVGNGKETISPRNEFYLRTLVTADCMTSDYQSWRIEAVLQATDPLYQETNGEQITEKSYDFISRAHRISCGKPKRMGSKTPEYIKINPGTEYEQYNKDTKLLEKKFATTTKYIRRSRLDWIKNCLEDFADENIRGLSKLSKECFDQIKNSNGEYYGIGEKYDDKLTIEEDESLSDGDETYVGNLRNFLPGRFVQQLLTSKCYRNEVKNTHDGAYKMDVDAVAALAMIIAAEIVNDYSAFKDNKASPGIDEKKKDLIEAQKKILKDHGIEPSGKRAITGEHARSFMRDAYYNYREQFVNDDLHRSFVNYFLSTRGIQVKKKHYEKGDLIEFEDYDPQENILLDPNDKAKKSNAVFDNEFIADDEDDDNTTNKAEKINKELSNTPQFNNPNNASEVDNSLDEEFYINQETKEATDKLEIIESAISHFEKIIKKRISESNLNDQAKQSLLKLTFLETDSTDDEKNTINIKGITQTILDKLNLKSEETELIKNQIDEIDKIRTERIKLIELKTDLGGYNYEENLNACKNHEYYKQEFENSLNEYLQENSGENKDVAFNKVFGKETKKQLKKLEEKLNNEKPKEVIENLKNLRVPVDKLSETDKKRKDKFQVIPQCEFDFLEKLVGWKMSDKELKKHIQIIINKTLANLESKSNFSPSDTTSLEFEQEFLPE